MSVVIRNHIIIIILTKPYYPSTNPSLRRLDEPPVAALALYHIIIIIIITFHCVQHYSRLVLSPLGGTRAPHTAGRRLRRRRRRLCDVHFIWLACAVPVLVRRRSSSSHSAPAAVPDHRLQDAKTAGRSARRKYTGLFLYCCSINFL